MRTNPDTSADTLPVLGAPIRQATPAAAPTPVAPGVIRQADGRLATNAPDPAPVWVAPAPVVAAPAPVASCDEFEAIQKAIAEWNGY